MSKIYKVEFYNALTPAQCSNPEHVGTKECYFGSLAAIYGTFPEDIIGCKVTNLWNIGVARGVKYDGDKCQISVFNVEHKQTKRGRVAK